MYRCDGNNTKTVVQAVAGKLSIQLPVQDGIDVRKELLNIGVLVRCEPEVKSVERCIQAAGVNKCAEVVIGLENCRIFVLQKFDGEEGA